MSGAEPVVLAFTAGLVLAVVGWVGRPLWRGDEPLPPPDPRVVSLLAQRQGALAALRDLDADHDSGRVTEADYVSLRSDITHRGAVTLAALDALTSAASERMAGVVDRIEEDVASRRSTVMAAACAGCGELVPTDARFCPACGAAVGGGPRGRVEHE